MAAKQYLDVSKLQGIDAKRREELKIRLSCYLKNDIS
jgi:hypothetical protein